MSRQVVRTHPLKFLSVWQLSILVFLGIYKECLPLLLTGSSRAFYNVWSPVTLKMEGSLTFTIMMALRGWQSHHYPTSGWQRLLGGWLVVPLVFSLYRRRRVGHWKRPGNVLSSMLLTKWVMIAREMGSCLGRQLLGPDWTSGRRVGRATCPSDECLMSLGWLATCTLRGGPYRYKVLEESKQIPSFSSVLYLLLEIMIKNVFLTI